MVLLRAGFVKLVQAGGTGMALLSNLQKRRTGYYYRQWVPLHLVEHIGKREIIKSLKTHDPSIAKKRCYEVGLQVSDWFDTIEVNSDKQGRRITLDSETICTMPSRSTAMTLSELLDKWAGYKGWDTEAVKAANSSYVETARVVRDFIEQYADKSISDISSDDVRGFRNYYQRDKSLNAKTVIKYLGCLRKLLNHAVSQGYADQHRVASGVFLVDQPKQQKAEKTFAPEELETIFNSPLFTGYQSNNRKHLAGKIVQKNADYWIPLILLVTGARVEEIAQLYTDDIKQEGDIWYFDLCSDRPDQKLKNVPSHRKIPFHYELFNLGFSKYVKERIKQKDERLFPDLNLSRDNRYSKVLSQRFGRYMKSININDTGSDGKVFHAYRHGFKDFEREAGISRDISDRLTGHSDGSVSNEYGSGYSIKRLHEAINTIRLPINLSHLYDCDKVIIPPAVPEDTVPLAPPKQKTLWIPLARAYELFGGAKYGESFDVANVKLLAQDNRKQPIDQTLTVNVGRKDLLINHPLFENESNFAALPEASAEVCQQANELRNELLKGLNGSIAYQLIDATTGEAVSTKPKWLADSPDTKIYFVNGLIDLRDDNSNVSTYKMQVDSESFEQWIKAMGYEYAG